MNPYDAYTAANRRDYFELFDAQLEPSVALCPVCGGEIYRGDPVASISGRLVHEECMVGEARDHYPVYPAVSFL